MMIFSEAEWHPSTTDELLAHAQFQEWVRTGGTAHQAYWEAWLVHFPERKPAMDTASGILSAIRFSEHRPDEKRREAANAAYVAALYKVVARERRVVVRMRWMAAAVVTGLIALSGGWLFWQQHRMQVITTGYGEVQHLTLPDQTTVVLQANSSLRYPSRWQQQDARNVVLDGEAFFSVPPDREAQAPFSVELAGAKIVVLGTDFNVSHRRKMLEVVLMKGKVRVDVPGRNVSSILRPGEMFRLSGAVGQPAVFTADTAAVAARVNGQLLLHRTNVAEVLQYLEDNYGYEVRSIDSTLLQKQLEGELTEGRPEDIIFILSQLLDADITVTGKTLDIRKR